ncbi:MAG: Crp/Fnr family transcriptional regulator, partial [Clostridiales bacterium]|nr:Crp/Fnr family transcriptional regulator [Clostridiales bacterium]
MEWNINPNKLNQLGKGTVIFTEGESVFSIALVIKGRVLIQNNGAKLVVSSGAFLGVNDLYTGKYQSTYTAVDDLLIYAFSVNQQDDLEQVLSMNNDYHGFMVASNNHIISELDQIYRGF